MRIQSLLSASSAILVGLFATIGYPTTIVAAEGFASERSDLDDARQLWNQQQITGYRFLYDRIDPESPMGYSYPWIVSVEEEAATPLAQDNQLNPVTWDVPPRFDDLFNVIEDQIESEATHMEVSYDEDRGFPSSIYIILANGTVYDVEVTEFQEEQQLPTQLERYSSTTNTAERHQELEELQKAKELWRQEGISSYRYSYNQHAPYPINRPCPWIVTVQDTTVICEDAEGKDVTQGCSEQLLSVDSLLERIQTALESNTAQSFQATYSKDYGYPETISMSYNDAIGFDVEIDMFRELPPEEASIAAIDYVQVQKALIEAKELWQTKSAYEYNYVYSPKLSIDNDEDDEEAAYPWVVHVQNGVPIKTMDNSNPAEEITWTIPPILDSFFQVIQDQIDAKAQQIDVEYNADFGFPQRINITTHSGHPYEVEILGWSQDRDAQKSKSGKNKYAQEQEELDHAKALWQSKGIENYDYLYHPQLTGPGAEAAAYPRTVHVEDALPFHTWDANQKAVTVEAPSLSSFFAIIQDAIDSNASEVEVQYNDDFGFPDSIHIGVAGDDSPSYDVKILGWNCNQGSPACDV